MYTLRINIFRMMIALPKQQVFVMIYYIDFQTRVLVAASASQSLRLAGSQLRGVTVSGDPFCQLHNSCQQDSDVPGILCTRRLLRRNHGGTYSNSVVIIIIL